MEVLLFVLAWLASGALGAFLTLFFFWRTDLDVTWGEVPPAVFLTFVGPIGLICGVVLSGATLISVLWGRYAAPHMPDKRKVIWKRMGT